MHLSTHQHRTQALDTNSRVLMLTMDIYSILPNIRTPDVDVKCL